MTDVTEQMRKELDRREFLKVASGGLAVLAMSQMGLAHAFLSRDTRGIIDIRLSITEVLVEMVDLSRVYMWAFEDPVVGPKIPGPVIMAIEGDTIRVTITNSLNQPHAFSVPGVIDSGTIPPGQTRTVTFAAPRAGTYFYLDPLNVPVNRVLGLHGALVVLPAAGNTPYSDPTPQVQRLFDDFGNSPAFPGNPWKRDRSFIWLFNSIDPKFNAIAQTGATIDPVTFVQKNTPRYFTLNGKSGFFAAEDPASNIRGRIGQPTLIRTLNAGLPQHSPHIHGNHVYELTEDGVVQSNVFLVDTWRMPPLKRRDVLLPFRQPPDIPEAVFPPREESFPLVYPMHCHTEMSQTAAGGNYPQGLITHWMIEGTLVERQQYVDSSD